MNEPTTLDASLSELDQLLEHEHEALASNPRALEQLEALRDELRLIPPGQPPPPPTVERLRSFLLSLLDGEAREQRDLLDASLAAQVAAPVPAAHRAVLQALAAASQSVAAFEPSVVATHAVPARAVDAVREAERAVEQAEVTLALTDPSIGPRRA
jgi:hypothetical protein